MHEKCSKSEEGDAARAFCEPLRFTVRVANEQETNAR